MTGGAAPVGSLQEEAARLAEALTDWLRGAAPAAAGFASHAAGAASAYTSAHIGGDSAECQLCPVCQLLAVFRGSRPEVFEHLHAAVGSFAAAMRAAMEAHERSWTAGRRPPSERIDIT